MTKTQQFIVDEMKKGATLSTNVSSSRGQHTHEAWLSYTKKESTGVNGETRVSIASVKALEVQGVIVATRKEWTGSNYILAKHTK